MEESGKNQGIEGVLYIDLDFNSVCLRPTLNWKPPAHCGLSQVYIYMLIDSIIQDLVQILNVEIV